MRRSATRTGGVAGVAQLDHGEGHGDGHGHGRRHGPGDEQAAAAARPSYLAGQARQQRRGHRLLAGRAREDVLVDAGEQPGQPGQLADGAGAVVAAGEVLLERQALVGGQGAEHVGAGVVGELAAHAVTPISSSASRRARRA